LMTVEQYRQIPEREDVIQELHWGQIITLTRPKSHHVKLQSRLVRLRRTKAEHLGYIESELPRHLHGHPGFQSLTDELGLIRY
jgi:hypothetical protein